MASILGAVLLLFSAVLAQDGCSQTPIYLDFHDRRVDGGISIQYGLFTGIGTPSQNLSQWPSLSNNDTYVASLDYCTGSPFEDCLELSHGFYDPALSEDYQSTSSYQSLDANLGTIPATLAEYAIDTFNFFVHYFDPSPAIHTPVPDFAVTVLSNYSSATTPWFGPAGLLGLGPSSTILSRSLGLGLITTRSYGLYMGTYYKEGNGLINGSLTLGGYDSGRFEGEVHNYSIGIPNAEAHHSPFSVTISQMTLTDNNGDETGLLTEDFEAYLTTHQYEINLPRVVLDTFADKTGATAADGRYQLPAGFNSSLTMTLSSGLTLTFEPEWLKNVSNNSPFSTTASDAENGNSSTSGPALLGSAFFTHIYMMVNYDAKPEPIFYLASALPHGPYVMTRTLCEETQPTPAPATNISSFQASGMAGAIVGGVVGGIGLTFLVWWIIRKYAQMRMRRNQQRLATKGKFVEGGNVSIAGAGRIFSKSKGSPSSFGSTDEYDRIKNESDPNIDERHRSDSAEMADFAFAFNDGLPRGYMQEADPNSANSPSSVMSSGYAMVAREMTPSVVQVQQNTHTARAYHASIHDHDDEYAHDGSPATPMTAQPLVGSTLYGGQQSHGFPSASQPAHNFRGAEPSVRSNLPPIRTEFAPPPGKGHNGDGKGKGNKKESLLRKVFPPTHSGGS
ncbi:uncharacterized protein A1O9_09027 [Exophiala aquamarina CBS 119918]|uniref:Peptidase A1 domain-containing protein n=1 Tax=Exophiala aquamarina CBS 119918 TaxID=1182545 RepID=A0A072PG92_9EURO|nr:uncharacterized protein A1O9_09027 [Exophiala aquamarina CBS 119918]KEF54585.1 hypothetical protein A1O9_09027 [Exophiala aquamarina CBS 119918]